MACKAKEIAAAIHELQFQLFVPFKGKKRLYLHPKWHGFHVGVSYNCIGPCLNTVTVDFGRLKTGCLHIKNEFYPL